MNQKQLNKLLSPNDREEIYIPNEIFKDIFNSEQLKSAKSIAFTYNYYCLITYLYRYCKYGQGEFFTSELIKEILGYAGNNKTLDYIIKKNGILDCLQYTLTMRNFPISYEMGDYNILNFTMYSDLDLETKIIINMSKNFKIKYPVKAFHRTEESRDENLNDGTFYDISNTHLFDINIFIDMVGNEEIGTIGFYLYQYLKYKNDLFKGGYTVSFEKLEKECGVSKNTIMKYSNLLESKGYLDVINNGYRDDHRENDEGNSKHMFPNTYKVLCKG
ncbi:helix-turn-helix domain-containing protein [Paenibacillus medicaginis]|uniref:Helix-turn-helix domain-containing protein n=1 Tax=Paenibacillus medicaginis TaxID=1470560 RepID=A0ABV5BV06_9BACL